MPGVLKFFLTRSFVFYALCFFLIWRMLDVHQLTDNAVPQTMSRLTPPIDYFLEFVEHTDHYNQYALMNCINYHKAVADFFPFQGAEANGMLGFCYERLGQESLAIASYQKAIALNPDYFWPYYDLGVIYYHRAQYAQAADYFQKAIEQAPIKTIVLLSRSKVYFDVKLSQTRGTTYDLLQGLEEGRTKAFVLLMDSLYKAGLYTQLLNTAIYEIKEGLDTEGISYYYAGLAAFNLKDYSKAVEFFQLAVQTNPHNADAYMYLGMCMHLAGREDLAALMMAKASFLHAHEGSMMGPLLEARVRFF